MDETIRKQNLARYHEKKEYYNRNKKQRDRERNAERQHWLDRQKDKPCLDCGIRFPARAMDFHHVNGDGMGRPGFNSLLRRKDYKEVILREIEKCILICANCHRLRH